MFLRASLVGAWILAGVLFILFASGPALDTLLNEPGAAGTFWFFGIVAIGLLWLLVSYTGWVWVRTYYENRYLSEAQRQDLERERAAEDSRNRVSVPSHKGCPSCNGTGFKWNGPCNGF